MKWNVQEMYVSFFKTWCLEGSILLKKDGSPLCGLASSYTNFNRPSSSLRKVQLVLQASYIVSFYPHFILNFFTSLFTLPPGQRTLHLTLDTSKNTFENVPSLEFLRVTWQISKKSVVTTSKYKVGFRRQALGALFDNLIHFWVEIHF